MHHAARRPQRGSIAPPDPTRVYEDTRYTGYGKLHTIKEIAILGQHGSIYRDGVLASRFRSELV